MSNPKFTALRYFVIIIVAFFLNTPVMAQRKCGTAEVLAQRVKEIPRLQQLLKENENKMRQGQYQQQLRALTEAVPKTVIIPVVVHIVLNDTSAVTMSQILSQLNVLNNDFSAMNADLNHVPAIWQPIIGNARINFCLAQRTPDNEPTNGVVRVKSNKRYTISNSTPEVKYDRTGGSNAWNTKNYLNIWITDLTNDYLGVTAPPGTGFPPEQLGVVIDYQAFGTTGSVSRDYSLGRTATHEIGHYFGLKHIWGDDGGDCTLDDGIDDTPLQGDHTFGCPTFPTTDNCSTVAPGIMFMNYMDYTDDACMNLFTAGQVNRMRYVLENITTTLLNSKGCSLPSIPEEDAALINVLAPTVKICDNLILPMITLRNKGLKPLTAVTIWYQLNNNPLTAYQWTGNLSSLNDTIVSLPAINISVGTYNLTAYTQSPNGMSDENISNDTIRSVFHYDAEATLPFEQSFEEDSFPPPGWDLYNPDQSITWERADDVGKNSLASALINNYNYFTNDQADDLITPVIAPQSFDSVFLFFDVAAAIQTPSTTNNNNWDTLKILVTADCGQTNDIVYTKWGPNLITRAGTVTTSFVPAFNEWRRDSINLTTIVQHKKFQVIFRNISNGENNIYIDNIRIVGKAVNPLLRAQGWLVNPNPTQGIVWITFYQVPADLLQIAIYNARGQFITQQPASKIDASNRITFNLVNEPNGIYFVKLIYKNRANTIKLMKVR